METTNTLAWMQVAEIELVYKSKVKPSERPQVVTSHDAFKLFKQNWDENKIGFIEQFKVLFLNRAIKVLAIYELSTGGVTGTVVDPKLVFAAALKLNACNIILCHNHPSGSLKPSRADEELTLKIKEAGRYLDLPVIDHLIITARMVSFHLLMRALIVLFVTCLYSIINVCPFNAFNI